MDAATPTGGDLVARAIRTARLERAAYEEVEHDSSATVQAAIVVVVGAVASAIGIGVAGSAGMIPGGAVQGGVLGNVIGETITALIAWAAYAYAAYIVGTTILKGPETHADWGQVARTLGFASGPRVFLVLGVVPVAFGLVSLVVGIWLLVTTIVAVRASLDVSTGRAIAIAIVAWLALGLVSAIVGSLF